MKWIGPIVVMPLWAFGVAQLFVQGWLLTADLAIAVIALVRGRMTGLRAVQAIVGSLIAGVVCAVLLRISPWLVVDLLGYGRTGLEQILFAVFAVLSVVYLVRRFPAQVRKSWQTAMTRPADPAPPPAQADRA